MAATPSTMLELGTTAPLFSLPEPATGDEVSLADFDGKPLLVVFSCNHCPYVLHIIDSFTAFANQAQRDGLAVVMISANDATDYPADSPEKMAGFARDRGFEFPYLYDASQQVARAYSAACTPDFFLFDANHRLAYRGQYDGARPNTGVAVDGRDLKAAVGAVLAGDAVTGKQSPSVGCSIKWRAANQPD